MQTQEKQVFHKKCSCSIYAITKGLDAGSVDS